MNRPVAFESGSYNQPVFSSSIRSRLVALVLAVALPFAAALVWAFSVQVRREHAVAQNLALRIARSVRSDLDYANGDTQALLSQLAEHPTVRNSTGACQSLFPVVGVFPGVLSLVLCDAHGNLICSVTPRKTDVPFASAAAALIPTHLAADGTDVSKPLLVRAGNRWMTVGFHSVQYGGGRVGTLALIQYLDLHLGGYPPETVVTLSNDAGRIVYRSKQPELFVGKRATETAIARAMARQREGSLEAVGLDGVLRQYGFTHVAGLGWRVGVGLPADVAMATVRSLMVNGTLAGLLTLAIVVFLAIRLSRSIERPLHDLTGAAQRVAEKGFSGHVPTTGPREVALVARAFNHMVASREAAERELIESRAQLEALSDELLHVQEDERTRLARQVHDDLGQLLTALNMDVTGLLESTRPADARQIAMTQRIRDALARMLDSVQRISAELRPAMLDDFGLAAAIESEMHAFEARTGIECDLSMPRGEVTISPKVDAAIYRIVQEALTNVARHSDASRVEFRVRERPGELLVELRDDGRGIPREALTSRRSLGLIGMRERARGIGATLEIEGVAGRGTIVSLRVPLRDGESEKET